VTIISRRHPGGAGVHGVRVGAGEGFDVEAPGGVPGDPVRDAKKTSVDTRSAGGTPT
jgi:hypothetical protein